MTETIMELINNCAFPIAMCVCMFNYMKTECKENTRAINELCTKIATLIEKE